MPGMLSDTSRFPPTWATRPLQSGVNRTKPPFGVPRRTQSLCPRCNVTAVSAVCRDAAPMSDFRDHPGLIEAEIVEANGRIVMRKTCARHGTFEDTLSTNPAFFQRMESLYFRRDMPRTDDESLNAFGWAAPKTGRGTALIVDMTNRCNLKCWPCFMDANQVPYVHELSMDDIRRILDRALAVKPRRDINILFSGGEPTISARFLDAVRYAKSIGFNRLCVVTNGVRFAQEPEFAAQCRSAGLHQVYLQLDGTTNGQHSHRGARNLFDVKRQAMDNISGAGMKTNLQFTVINGVNDHVVGDIVRFAVDNIDKIRSVLFQPIMFAGRDAGVADDEQRARRYTFADLATDLGTQCGAFGWEPMRDWFPMSIYSAFGNLFDRLHPYAEVGSLYADAHPSQAIVSPLLVNQITKAVVPISAFVDVEGLLHDVATVADEAKGVDETRAILTSAVLMRFDARRAPVGFTVADLSALLERLLPRFRSDAADWRSQDNGDPRWRLLMIAGMWFQDLFNMDLEVIGMDAVATATQEGEISFCAYNSAGWRSVIEHFHKTGSLAVWHNAHGRHAIYANGSTVPLSHRGEEAPTARVDLARLAALSETSSASVSRFTGEPGQPLD